MSMCKKNKRVRLSTLIGVFGACLLSSFQFVSYGQPVEAYAHKDSLVIDSTALNVKTKDLSEVVVRGRKWAKISRYSALSMPLSTLDLQTTPMALGDILGGLQVVPSVQGNDADGRLIVSGGGPNETQTYIDGLLVMHPNTLGMTNINVRSRFSPELFQDIALHAGGYNASIGHALSGIINLKTETLPRNSKKLVMGLNTTGLSLSQMFGNKNSQFYIKGSYLDLTPYGLLIKDSYDWRRRYNQQCLDLLYSTQGKSWEVKMQGFASMAGAKYSFSTIDEKKREQGLSEQYLFYQIGSLIKLSNFWKASMAGNVSLWGFGGNNMLQDHDNVATRDFASHSRLDIQHIGQTWIFRAGIDNLFQKYHQTYTIDQSYQMSYISNIFANYVDLQYNNSHITGNIGLRSEYNSLSNKINLLPRFYLAWKDDYHLLAFATGKYTQTPPSDYLKFSPNLENSVAWNNTLTYSFIPNNDKYSISIFYKKYSSLPTYTKKQKLPAYWEYKMDGSGCVYGGNLFVKKAVNLFEFWGSYAFTLGKIRSEDQMIAMPISYAAKHSIKTTLKYWIPRCRILIGTSYYWDSGIGDIRGFSIPERTRLDLSCSYLPTPKVVIYFSIINALNKQNYWGVEFSDEDASRFRYITNPSRRFIHLGCFITLGYNNKRNISPIRL